MAARRPHSTTLAATNCDLPALVSDAIHTVGPGRGPRHPHTGMPPARGGLTVPPGAGRIDIVMHEYDAIRGEIQGTLANQVSVLTFGSATVGLLVSSAAELWDSAPVLAGLLLLLGVPLVCFLTMTVYTGELLRLLRAGLFVNCTENFINSAAATGDTDELAVGSATVLTWEQWGAIRRGGCDVDKLNRIAISVVFYLLAGGFGVAGHLRLHTAPGLPEGWVIATTAGGAVLALLAAAWVGYLCSCAYRFRRRYRYSHDGTESTL